MPDPAVEFVMNQVQALATDIVGRGVAALWAGLGIVVLLLSFEPSTALHVGGVLALAIATYLALCSDRVSQDQITQASMLATIGVGVWPRQSYTQEVIGGALRQAHLRFARDAVGAAVVFFASSLLVSLVV